MVTRALPHPRLINSKSEALCRSFSLKVSVLIVFIKLALMAYNYFDNLDSVAKSRYQRKLELIQSNECPYKLPAGVWENNPSSWPDVQYDDIYSYLIDSPGVFTRTSMRCYKSLDAYNYFISGWVQTVLSYTPEHSPFMLLRANVVPSQRVNETPHHPWVALSSDGSVSAAHCDCMAGLAESCSHIGALLYKIERAVRKGYTKVACTDEPCKWNVDFVKKVQPSQIKNIKFYGDEYVAKTNKGKSSHHVKATEEEQEVLLKSLFACNSKPVVLSTFNNFSEKFHWKKQVSKDPVIPQSLRSLYSPAYEKLDSDSMKQKCSEIFNTLSINQDVVRYIYDVTKHQSASMTWHEQRIGRITSSVAHVAHHTDKSKPSVSLIKEICNPKQNKLDNVPAIQWGRSKEIVALQEYSKTMTAVHKEFTRNPAGLLICLKKPFLAASADSVAECACHGRRVVEVKCPFAYKDSSFEEYVKAPTACIEKTSSGFSLKKKHKYFSQVQMQMFVHDVSICDFVIHTCKMTAVIYVQRDEEYISCMIASLTDFFTMCVLPELLTRRIEQHTSASVFQDTKLYCICRTPEDGKLEMIGCDNPTCDIQWYHLKCLKMKRIPKGNWICKKCKKNN